MNAVRRELLRGYVGPHVDEQVREEVDEVFAGRRDVLRSVERGGGLCDRVLVADERVRLQHRLEAAGPLVDVAHQPGGMRLLAEKAGELLIDLGPATWRIVAEPDRLVLRVECADAGQLGEVSAHVAERVEQIGRRDGLRVEWQPGVEE